MKRRYLLAVTFVLMVEAVFKHLTALELRARKITGAVFVVIGVYSSWINLVVWCRKDGLFAEIMGNAASAV